MLLKIPRLYDSHTHFLATGSFATGLFLNHLQSRDELKNIKPQKSYFRRHWLLGFGWDDKNWVEKPHKDFLDQLFPMYPVFLGKADGHSCWLNSKALEELGLESQTGVFTEKEHFQIWDKLPPYSDEQLEFHILNACRVFNQAGFTHVRDMTCTPELWDKLVQMSQAGALTLAIEENYTIYSLSELELNLKRCEQARTEQTELVKIKGIKIFYDGSLGSETALLSGCYCGTQHSGRSNWALEDVAEVLRQTWSRGFEVSVHVIGDQAVHDIVRTAREVSQKNYVGRLNLEHAQVVRPETIQMMKPLHIRCHMQPCHWLSDRKWLRQKLGPLYDQAFPWEALRLAKIPISFGCDSPVEPPSFVRNFEALKLSPSEGIREYRGDIGQTHSHPSENYCPESYSVFENEHLKKVVFNGKVIFTTSCE